MLLLFKFTIHHDVDCESEGHIADLFGTESRCDGVAHVYHVSEDLPVATWRGAFLFKLFLLVIIIEFNCSIKFNSFAKRSTIYERTAFSEIEYEKPGVLKLCAVVLPQTLSVVVALTKLFRRDSLLDCSEVPQMNVD